MLEDFDAELKLVIAGNHDLRLDGEYWAKNLSEEDGDEAEEYERAVEIMTGDMAKRAGVTYLTEGVYEFALKNRASLKVFASPYQPEFGNWAFGYPRTQDRWTKIPDGVDIVMTHGPPFGILDFAHGQHMGCSHLLNAMERVRPMMHCFGHIHEGYGVQTKIWDGGEGEAPAGSEKAVLVKAEQAETWKEKENLVLQRGRSTIMVNAAIVDEGNRHSRAPWVLELPLRRGE